MGDEWYNNKDLFEMIRGLTDEIKSVKTEMHETRMIIKEYNGLRKSIGKCEKRLDAMEVTDEVKKENTSNWKQWISWVIAAVMAGLNAILILKQIF